MLQQVPAPLAHAVKFISFMCNPGICQTASALGLEQVRLNAHFLRAESQFLIAFPDISPTGFQSQTLGLPSARPPLGSEVQSNVSLSP